MSRTYETKKFGADKIVLLGLFALALLIARHIVVSRSAIVFTEPIELDYTGISVSIPVGNGWQSGRKWAYQKDSFVLSSFFNIGSANPTAVAHCRYLLAAAEEEADVRLSQKASAVGATIVKTGQIQIEVPGLFAGESQNKVAPLVKWAQMKSVPKEKREMFDIFYGTAQLPNNRRLDIEVRQLTDDLEMAELVFKHIAESVKFTDNQLLKAGSEVVAEIKSAGINHFFDGRKQQSFFVIKDLRRRPVGFAMDVFIDIGRAAQLNIQAAGFSYIRGRYAREKTEVFQGRNNLEEFIWKSGISGLAGRSGTETVLDKSGIMTVRGYDASLGEEGSRPGPAAIPDVFSDLLFKQMFGSNRKEILVDIIDSDGTVIPTLVSREEGEDFAADAETAYVFRVEFLNGQGFSEQVYLDDQQQVIKRIIRQNGIYTMERSSAEDILEQFPEQADYILQKSKMLEQNRQ